MTYFALFLKSEFGMIRPCPVHADSYEEVGDSTHFKREGRLVFQAPTPMVHSIEEFEYQLPMQKRIEAFRSRRAGAATMHVHEYGCAVRVAPGKKVGKNKGKQAVASGMVESVTISIADPTPARRGKRK